MYKQRAKIVFVFLLTLILTFNLLGCSQSSTNGTSKSNLTQNSATESAKTFTKTELSKYNGQNSSKAYVAVDGKVYDVTNEREWVNGQHENYQAGTDLTSDMKNSPHGTRVLDGLTVVGNLTE